MNLTELPIFDQIMADGELPPRQLQVWREISKHLDVVRARKIPKQKVERALKLERSTLDRHLVALIDAGYLVRENGLYRIPLSREIDDANHETDAPDANAASAEVIARKARTARQRVHSSGVF